MGNIIISNIDNKSIKIIFLTAIPNSEAMKKIDKLGVDALISKPFNLNDFEIISDILRKDKKI
ncbi:MAG: hypothetical protein ACFFHD_03560 [Promethearchaeota archaeon]